MRKGRNTFTGSEAEKIRELLRQKIKAGNLKAFRDQLRAMGFYISDFSSRIPSGFSVDDFDQLVRGGQVIIRS
jgi:hypothetical protein